MPTQEQIVIEQLKTGSISRNWALQKFITRLGAIINTLNKKGWEIKGEYEKHENGQDFVYRVKNSPISACGVKTPPQGQILTKIAPQKARLDNLNDQLLEILKTIPVSWENQSRLLEVKNALKSKSDYLKQVIISKYENQN